jgi:hypothetical protein
MAEKPSEDRKRRATRLVEYLIEVFGTQVEAATAVRVSRPSLWALKEGRTPFTGNWALSFAAALELPVDLIDSYLDGEIEIEELRKARANQFNSLVSQARSLPLDDLRRLVHEITRPE